MNLNLYNVRSLGKPVTFVFPRVLMFSETKVIFLDSHFNSNKRITRANHNSRLGNYNNTNLILKTTEWMIYKVFSLYYLHHFTPLAAVFFSGNFWDSFKNRCFWAWGFVFVLLCSFTNSKVACVASVSLRFRSKRTRNESQRPREKWLSFHFSRGQNRSFFAPKPNNYNGTTTWKRLLRRLIQKKTDRTWQCFSRRLSRHFPPCFDHVLWYSWF